MLKLNPRERTATDVRTLNRFFGLCVLGLGISLSYAIARPATDALYNDVYGKEGFPWVWLAVAATTMPVVAAYNRYAATISLIRLFSIVSLLSGAVLAILLPLRSLAVGPITFMLYVWKDIYMVVLVEIIWSYANTVFNERTARRGYGVFMAIGTLGALGGNFSVAWLANHTELGTLGTLRLVVPLLIGLGAFGLMSKNLFGDHAREARNTIATTAESLKVLLSNRYLTRILILIAMTQFVILIVDYQYQGMLEVSFTDADAKTEMNGLVYGTMQFGVFMLQLLAGGLLRILGVGGTLIMVPLLLGGAIFGWFISASLITMAAAKVASKAFDYSIFRIAKEILYIPLNYEQKTLGKAWIDILAYRATKGAAAFLLLGLGAIGATGLPLDILTVVFLLAWLVITVLIVRQFREFSAAKPDESSESSEASSGKSATGA